MGRDDYPLRFADEFRVAMETVRQSGRLEEVRISQRRQPKRSSDPEGLEYHDVSVTFVRVPVGRWLRPEQLARAILAFCRELAREDLDG